MPVICQNCGRQLQDPGGSLEERHCGVCHSGPVIRVPIPPSQTPGSQTVAVAAISALIGGMAFGLGGAFIGGIIGGLLGGSKERNQ